MNYKQAYLEHRKAKLPNKAQRLALKEKRMSNGVTQSALAHEFGVDQTRISLFENDNSTLADSEFLFFSYKKRFN
jgi:DNA-binding XRE family transcriptional regulator